jgi:RNA-directed DNA polymerase
MMREESVSEPKPNGKPFVISKRLVWEAWLKVKANKGVAGVDEESIEEFERNLAGNLYKLWNRLSSGSYIPPPVRAVEIPKRSGGSRMLGIGRDARHWTWLRAAGSAAGSRTG